MTATPATRARATERGPMAHRAPGSAARPLEAARRRLPAPMADALAEEAAEFARIVRRAVPSRRIAFLVGLALLAIVAVGGIAGAAEPKPAARSALEAFGSTPAPSFGQTSGGAMAVAPSAAPAASTPTSLADDPAFKGPDLPDLGAKTALVLALLFVTLRVMRRAQSTAPGMSTGTLSVLESRPLGPKTQLHLVAVGDRRLVIGQSPAGLVALGELDAAELPAVEPVRDPWAKRDAHDADPDPELEAQVAHELATGRRSRLGVSA
jgi:flagellar biosynthetic protein FliO